MSRGMLTEKVNEVACATMGRDITQAELRLMPYLQHCVMNDQNIDVARVNQEDREILSKWREEKRIEGGASNLACSKEFWLALNEILWVGYVFSTERGYLI